MSYSKKQMADAKDRTQKANGDVVGRKIGATGRMTMQVDQEAYMNAVDMNGGPDHSGKTCWDDSEFRGDMMKRHPEIAVAAEKAGSSVGAFTGAARDNFDAIFGDKSPLGGKGVLV